jgi:hypothetical protein
MIEFQGEVQARIASGAVNLQLRGQSRCDTSTESVCDTDIMFGGARPPELPATLHDVRVVELDSIGEIRRFRIHSAQRQLELQARSLQLHRAAGAAMFAAVPPQRVPWHVRAGWWLLLSVLGIPGVGGFILRGRGTS